MEKKKVLIPGTMKGNPLEFEKGMMKGLEQVKLKGNCLEV